MLLRLILLAAVAGVIWMVWRPRYDFRIKINRSGTQATGTISRAQLQHIREYFEETDLSAPSVTITGRREPNGRLTLRIGGSLPQGEQQMIRNFLMTVM